MSQISEQLQIFNTKVKLYVSWDIRLVIFPVSYVRLQFQGIIEFDELIVSFVGA